MTTPSNNIHFSDIDIELSYASNRQISLGDPYVRNLSGLPSGVISMADLESKTNSALTTQTLIPTLSGYPTSWYFLSSGARGTNFGTGYPLIYYYGSNGGGGAWYPGPYEAYYGNPGSGYDSYTVYYTGGSPPSTFTDAGTGFPGTTPGPAAAPTQYVTSTAARPQVISIYSTFFIEMHGSFLGSVYRNDGTLLGQTNGGAYEGFNYNVQYHTRQYRYLTVTDTIQPGATVGYYASVATQYNGDYDYSIGPAGFLNFQFSFSSWA